MTRESRIGRVAGLVFWLMRAIVGVAVVLVCAARLPASAAEPRRQVGDSVFKGHRLAAFIDEQTHRATIELDHRQVTAKDGVAEIGKINSIDIGSSFLYFLHLKTTAGCGSYIIVRVALVPDSGKSEVLPDFGGCNDQFTSQVETHPGWIAWYGITYRDDRATAQVAFIRDDKLTMKEVKAPPCLFAPVAQQNCLYLIAAEAAGTSELGVPTGDGAFADQKIATFLNQITGKATIQLNGRIFRTFDNVKDFYIAFVEGEDQFGLFAFFLKPSTGCSTRPLVFFAGRGSEPQVILDYAPCTEQIARVTRKKGKTIEWSGIAFHRGEPRGYIASVVDHKLSTRTTLLPLCIMDADKTKDESCALQALGQSAPEPSQPLLHMVPVPPPSASRKPPRPSGT